MIEELWILEYRTRNRKNGKWSEWFAMDNVNSGRAVTAYPFYPASDVFKHEKYERRAVKFTRAEYKELS